MTAKRVRFLQEFLKFFGLEGRLRLEWISSSEAPRFVEVVTGFTEEVRALGPSPILAAHPGHVHQDTDLWAGRSP